MVLDTDNQILTYAFFKFLISTKGKETSFLLFFVFMLLPGYRMLSLLIIKLSD